MVLPSPLTSPCAEIPVPWGLLPTAVGPMGAPVRRWGRATEGQKKGKL